MLFQFSSAAVPHYRRFAVSTALHLASAFVMGLCTTVYLGAIYLGAGRLLAFELINATLLIVLRASELLVGIAHSLVSLIIDGANQRLVVINATIGVMYAIIPAIIWIAPRFGRPTPERKNDAPIHHTAAYISGTVLLLLSLLLLKYTIQHVANFSQITVPACLQVFLSVSISFVMTFVSLALLGVGASHVFQRAFRYFSSANSGDQSGTS